MVQPDRPQVTIHRAHALCMVGNYGYRHTLRVCNTHCFSTTTTVTPRRLGVNFMRTLAVLFSAAYVAIDIN
jgi:hypothetical protein